MKVYDAAAAIGAYESYTQAPCISTGIGSLDNAIAGGLPVGQVTTLLGYTGVGKSEVARQMRSAAVKNGHPIVHVDVELGVQRIIERDIAQAAQIPSSSLRRKLLTKDELERYREALPRLADRKNFAVVSPPQGTGLKVLSTTIDKILTTFSSTKPALIILDSAQRLADGVLHDNDRVRVQRFCRWVEGFAHTHNAAILMTSEQRRSAEGKAPSPEEAATSGAESRAIEFISDVQLVLFSEGKISGHEAQDATAERVKVVRMLITKVRDGSDGYVKQDLHLIAPFWDMRLATGGEVDDGVLIRCAGQLEDGRAYSNKELEIVWATTQKRRKDICTGLLEAELLVKQGHSWLVQKIEKIVDQKTALV